MIADILRGERVRLAALAKVDLPIMAKWYENAAFMRLSNSIPAFPQTEASLAEWLERTVKAPDEYLFGVRATAEDTLLGFVSLEEIEWTHGATWLGIALDPAQWDKGYGLEALELLLRFALHELNLYRVHLAVFEYNERAIALYEKAGFQREGTFRESIKRDGKRFDLYLYGILYREWEARRGKT
jgi:RimJ/RimL family protein N-acetyltransferase